MSSNEDNELEWFGPNVMKVLVEKREGKYFFINVTSVNQCSMYHIGL